MRLSASRHMALEIWPGANLSPQKHPRDCAVITTMAITDKATITAETITTIVIPTAITTLCSPQTIRKTTSVTRGLEREVATVTSATETTTIIHPTISRIAIRIATARSTPGDAIASAGKILGGTRTI